MLTSGFHWNLLQWAAEHQNWNEKKCSGLRNHMLFLIKWTARCTWTWIIHVDVTLTPTWTVLQDKYTPSQKRYSLMAVVSFSRLMSPATVQKTVKEYFEEHKEELMTVPPKSPVVSSVGRARKTCAINRGPISQLTGLQGDTADILVPENTFRGFESNAQRVTAVLAEWKGPTQH